MANIESLLENTFTTDFTDSSISKVIVNLLEKKAFLTENVKFK